ncbi:MAG: MgtC/SapB family protein [Gemmatimonadales bacterium]
MTSDAYIDLAIALGVGLLIGLQKERVDSPVAGLRTFALVSVFGALTALISSATGPWVVVAGLIAITTFTVMGNVISMRGGSIDPGQTTEVAIVLTFLLGALVVIGPREGAIVLGATVAVLLHLRDELHGWVAKLSDQDVRAMMQFVVVSLIVLPVLPDQTYGPYDVLNPREIWWMVVLIVGLNLVGYGAFRLVGQSVGTALAGILGGVVSSTATTVTYARLSKEDESRTPVAVVIVWIASGIVFVRVLVEIAVVAPSFLPVAAGPIGVMMLVVAIGTPLIWRARKQRDAHALEPQNPAQLKPALAFGALYAAVLFLVAAAQDFLGAAGLFAAAAVSGISGMDAITLTASQRVSAQALEPGTAWRLIIVASLSNLVFKFSLAAAIGSREMATRIGILFTIAIAAGAGLIVLWP